jgi:magnesium chelatase family protein
LDKRRVAATVTVSVEPSETAAWDLPIAIGILAAIGEVPLESVQSMLFAGELDLDGQLRSIRGALPIALCAAKEVMGRCILPQECAGETVTAQTPALAASSLAAAVAHLRGEASLPTGVVVRGAPAPLNGLDWMALLPAFARPVMRRAAERQLNLLLIGPRGAGMQQIARGYHALRPTQAPAGAQGTAALYSAAGLLRGQALLPDRPFRAPHSTVSVMALQGTTTRIGELMLAADGSLFLDDLTEFLEIAQSAIARAICDGRLREDRQHFEVWHTLSTTLIAAMYGCPCCAPQGACQCSAVRKQRYRAGIQPSLLACFDFGINLEAKTLSSVVPPARRTPRMEALIRRLGVDPALAAALAAPLDNFYGNG